MGKKTRTDQPALVYTGSPTEKRERGRIRKGSPQSTISETQRAVQKKTKSTRKGQKKPKQLEIQNERENDPKKTTKKQPSKREREKRPKETNRCPTQQCDIGGRQQGKCGLK